MSSKWRTWHSTAGDSAGELATPIAKLATALKALPSRQASAGVVLPASRLLGRLATWDLRHVFLIALAVELGALVRLFFVVTGDFPVLDGGLFYTMIHDLRSTHYALPTFTTYNSARIPFVYPPLVFYAVGLLSDLSGWPVIDLVRLWPALMSILTVPVFFRLARRLLRSRNQVTIAVFAFALVPRSFNWEVVGGGLTRSTGFLLALLTLHQAYLLYKRPKARQLVLTTAFGAAALLSHMEMALFAAIGAVLLLSFYGRNRRAVIHAISVAAGVVVVTAPWWVTVLQRHGVSPWLSASQTGMHGWFSGLSLLLFDFTDEPYLAFIGALGLIGLTVALARRDYLLPMLLIVTFVLDPRKAPTTATVPLTMLAAIALCEVIVPALSRSQPDDGIEHIGDSLGSAFAKIVIVFIIIHTLISTVMAPYADPQSPLRTLSAGHRNAMTWLNGETPAAAKFAVVSETDLWAVDQISEWFPTLAGRPSVGTVQGREWLPGFAERVTEYEALQACAVADSACLDEWADETQTAFSHVYVAKTNRRAARTQRRDCCAALRQSLQTSPEFTLLYENDEAAVFVRKSSQ